MNHKGRTMLLVILLGTFILTGLFISLYILFADASDFQPLAVTGFNVDLIAENADGASADSSTTASFDGANSGGNNVMYSVNFRGPQNVGAAPPFGLPANGLIESTQNVGVSYQLRPYNGNNALLLTAQGSVEVLTLESSGSYEKIVLLASSAEGQSTFNVELAYSDGSSSTTNFVVQDWFGGNAYAVKGIGRVTRNDDYYAPNNLPGDADGAFSGNANDPRLYDCFIDNTANGSKVLTHISITKTSFSGRTAILAVTGQKNANAPGAPVAQAPSQLSTTSFDANWATVMGATSYRLDVATDQGFTTMLNAYNNLDVGSVSTYSVQGLNAGAVYYYRLRAVNANGTSFSSNYVTATTEALSSDATLSTVLGQVINPGPENGTNLTPKAATLQVAYDISAVGPAQVIKTHPAATLLFYGQDPTFTTASASSIALNAGALTPIYLQVQAQDTTTLSYKIDIYRQAQPPQEDPEPTTEAVGTTLNQAPSSALPESLSQIESLTESETVPQTESQSETLIETQTQTQTQTQPVAVNQGQLESNPAIAEVTTTAPQTSTDLQLDPPRETQAESAAASDLTSQVATEAPISQVTTENIEKTAASPTIQGTYDAATIIDSLFGGRQPLGPIMNMNLKIAIGSQASGKEVTVLAQGLKPFSNVVITLYSTPQVIGSATADDQGQVHIETLFPSDLPVGIHTLISSGTDPYGQPIQAVSAFEIDPRGKVVAFSEPAQVIEPIGPADPKLIRAMKANKPLYDPKRYPATVVSIVVVIAGLGGMSALGGLTKPRAKSPSTRNAQANQGNQGNQGEDPELIEAAAIEVDTDESEIEEKEIKWGDRSFLWKMPGTGLTDGFSVGITHAFSGISLLLKRLVSDGAWARAMFGSAGFGLWILGALLGIIASIDVNFMALPPSFGWVLALVALGILDGAAGALAWVMIGLLAALNGNITSFDDLRTLAGVSALLTSLMYLVGMRPIRRIYEKSAKYIYDRLLDYIMPAIIVSVTASLLLEAINGLSGLELFTEANLGQIKGVTVVALWLRLGFEDLAMWLFPMRCERVRPLSEKDQLPIFQWGAILAYEAMFLLISGPFFGFSTIIVIIMLMETVPWILSFFEEKLPNSEALFKWYPGPTSIYMLTLLLMINIYLSEWLMTESLNYQQMCVAFVYLLIPYTLAEFPSLIGRQGQDLADTWLKRGLETLVWIIFAAMVL